MQFSTVLQVFAAVGITGADAAFLEKNHYMSNFANNNLQRLQQYRNDHPDLNHGQNAVLDLSEKIVRDFSTADIPHVEALCASAFDKHECKVILTGEDSTVAARGALYPRYACTCSGESDWCDSTCDTGANCRTASKLNIPTHVFKLIDSITDR